jgi:TonB family protein
MKKTTMLFAGALMLLAAACKNERGDDTHMDTTTVTVNNTPEPAPVLPADSLLPRPDSVTTAATPGSGPSGTSVAATEKKPEKKATAVKPANGEQPSLDNRFRKTSKKGRILLAALEANAKGKIEADREGIYGRADIMPGYPGGEDALRRYIENHIEYPDLAINNQVEGTVKVYFTVDEQGKILNPTVVSQRLGSGLEEEALKVVKAMPKWTPGQVRGSAVKTRVTLPITYKIE